MVFQKINTPTQSEQPRSKSDHILDPEGPNLAQNP